MLLSGTDSHKLFVIKISAEPPLFLLPTGISELIKTWQNGIKWTIKRAQETDDNKATKHGREGGRW